MSNYPPGAANDPKAPYNKPLTIYRKVKVDIGVEISMQLEVEVECFNDDFGDIVPDLSDLRHNLKGKVTKILNIDGKDKVLNDIHVYDVR